MNVFRRIFGLIATFAFTVVYTFTSLGSGGINRELPTTPEDFEPVLRFIASSDCHIDDDDEKDEKVRFVDMFKGSYEYAESCDYDKIDAVIIAGDLVDNGRDTQYEIFNRLIDENMKDETQLLTCMGNHEFFEYRKEDPTVAYEKYKQYINEEVDTHVVINGYHFIGFSYDDNAKTFEGKLEWLDAQLKAATEEDPTKPVFVFQHPHPTLTVYGSVYWSNSEFGKVLRKYPQVIDFSGHSHYAASDPRSIWQGDYTAIGTASTRSVNDDSDYYGEKRVPGKSGTCWIVEVDAQGNTRLQLYDIANHSFFEDYEYYLSDVTNKKSHCYTWNNMKSLDTAPQFPENAEITASRNEEGDVILSFPDAEGYFEAENYRITVKNKILFPVWSETVPSNYVYAVSDGMNVDIGELESGTYYVHIKPCSPFAKGGKAIDAKITIE